MGLAARLVSGYLRESDAEQRRAEGSLHAWTEVFLPGAGWIGLDATNGIFCNHNFIRRRGGIDPGRHHSDQRRVFSQNGSSRAMTSRLQLGSIFEARRFLIAT